MDDILVMTRDQWWAIVHGRRKPIPVEYRHGVHEGYFSINAFKREDVTLENLMSFEDTPLDKMCPLEFAVDECEFGTYLYPLCEELLDPELPENKLRDRVTTDEPGTFVWNLEHNFYTLDAVEYMCISLRMAIKALNTTDFNFWRGGAKISRIGAKPCKAAARWWTGMCKSVGEGSKYPDRELFDELITVVNFSEATRFLADLEHALEPFTHLDPDTYVVSFFGP